jgi:predicted SprT family Zn-dependent metalloprotease
MSLLTERDVEKLVRDTLDSFDLADVRFEWMNTKHGRMGEARGERIGLRYYPVRLRLSRPLFHALKNQDKIIDTILHAVAHLLAFKRTRDANGHNRIWRAICVEIGAKPRACYDFHAEVDVEKVSFKYTATCDRGCTFNFSRMGRHWRDGNYRCKHGKRLSIVTNY